MFSEKLTDIIGKIQKVAGPDFTIAFSTVNGKNIFDVNLEHKNKAVKVESKLTKIQKIIDEAGFTPREIKLPEILSLCDEDFRMKTLNFGFKNILVIYFDLGEYLARKIRECKFETDIGFLPVILEDELDIEMTVEGITEFLQYLGGGKVEPDEITNFLELAGY